MENQETVISGMSALDLAGIAAVVAAGIALIGQHHDEDEASLAFESAVRTHGGQNEDVQGDLKAGGAAIYQTINSLDDADFDFDDGDADEDEAPADEAE